MTDAPLIVIPTYNERESLPRTIAAVHRFVPAAHVLVVDDGSPDGTADWTAEQAEHDERIHLLRRTEKNGLGAAYLAGFAWALERDYPVICEMDADGSHRGRDLPQLLAAIADGADLAIGARWVPGGAVVNWPLNRQLLSRGANVYVNAAIGLGVHDATAGFRAYRREVLSAIDLQAVRSQGYGFQIDLTLRTARAGFAIAEVPIVFVEREYGESKMSGNIIQEAFVNVAKWGAAERARRVRAALARRS
ncbi:polyprenol monophosphomannose synthase [Brevibacterium rongguiense]|uniref:polyprenol monophosphomannose synthase n=1 Tax=Brevibacterium rongguiense TaxID=2695267 RepID=UPI002E2D2E4B|nr:polyprenol monophosphomannose synthase [Brevibacterium rongguiense]